MIPHHVMWCYIYPSYTVHCYLARFEIWCCSVTSSEHGDVVGTKTLPGVVRQSSSVSEIPPAISFLESVTAKIEITKTKVPTIWSRLKICQGDLSGRLITNWYISMWDPLYKNITYKQIPFEMCSPAGYVVKMPAVGFVALSDVYGTLKRV